MVDIVFLDKLRRYRIEAREFDHSVLGDQRQPGSEANIRTLARRFVHAAPHVQTNFDKTRLTEAGHTDIPTRSPHGLDDIVHWLINLVRFESS